MSIRSAVMILVSLSVIVLIGLGLGTGPVQANPVSITVNCNTGRTISSALATAPTSKPLVITVIGVCTETVTISRDDVTVQGASPSSGINAPAPTATVLTLSGAHRIILQQLEINYGATGLVATLGSSFQANALVVSNQSFAGVAAIESSAGELDSSTVANSTGVGIGVEGGSLTMSGIIVRNNGVGIAAEGGSLVASNSAIQNSNLWGVSAGAAGAILLQDSTVQGSRSDGVIVFPGGSVGINGGTIEDNGGNGVHGNGGAVTINGGVIKSNNIGVVAGHGSTVQIGGANITENQGSGVLGYNGGAVLIAGNTAIQSNNGDGLTLTIGASASISCNLQPFVCPTIANNANGVSVHDTSIVSISSGLSGPPPSVPSIINNSKWGIFCPAGIPGGIAGTVQATVTGNGVGQNNCPVYS